MAELFKVEHFSFTYPTQGHQTLDDLSFSIMSGEFVVLCGPSGCGKSTLLRQLKTALAPHGKKQGKILFLGTPLEAHNQRIQSEKIGFVQQSPDNQIVTDKVWHELAFGLESLGYDTPTIRRRVAEMASFFGIQTWFYKNVNALSGGQKQLLNLASIMVMQPDVLILDEPTSQLDPIAASDFLAILGKINRELGTTILLTEHRLEEAFALASRVMVLDTGKLLCQGTPQQVGQMLREQGHCMFLAMPSAMRVWASVDDGSSPCPITVAEGKAWIEQWTAVHPITQTLPQDETERVGNVVLSAQNVWFKYEKDAPDIVKGLSVQLHAGEFFAVLGGNGTGKTTSLKLLAGLLAPYRGQVEHQGNMGVLPQNPQALFVKKTVEEDLHEVLKAEKTPKEIRKQKVEAMITLCRLQGLLSHHPYDLSGGEQQRLALAKVLLKEPEILLLDEPTKGLDAEFKQVFAEILQDLLTQGVAIWMVSHDIEFCASYAHRCALFFDGNLVTEGAPRTFFAGNRFYTTSVNRMARDVMDDVITAEELVALCKGEAVAICKAKPTRQTKRQTPEETQAIDLPLPKWRKYTAIALGMVSILLLYVIFSRTDLSTLISPQGLTNLSMQEWMLYSALLLCMMGFALAVSRRGTLPTGYEQTPVSKRKLSKRTQIATFLIVILIPLTLLVGERYLGGKKYYFIALLILLECMVPFFMIFESRKSQARELILIAVLCAIGVAGRAVFFMLPQFKPILALTILSGVALGGETGFFVGAMTMLTSNMLFAQGPWTPWQMFAMGIIGFLAGVLFRKGWLRRSRGSLCVFGALTAILIYGGIMNFASAVMWTGSIDGPVLLGYYLSGFPMDCIHAGATWFFLWIASQPMLEKLDRIKVKYGLVE